MNKVGFVQILLGDAVFAPVPKTLEERVQDLENCVYTQPTPCVKPQ